MNIFNHTFKIDKIDVTLYYKTNEEMQNDITNKNEAPDEWYYKHELIMDYFYNAHLVKQYENRIAEINKNEFGITFEHLEVYFQYINPFCILKNDIKKAAIAFGYVYGVGSYHYKDKEEYWNNKFINTRFVKFNDIKHLFKV